MRVAWPSRRHGSGITDCVAQASHERFPAWQRWPLEAHRKNQVPQHPPSEIRHIRHSGKAALSEAGSRFTESCSTKSAVVHSGRFGPLRHSEDSNHGERLLKARRDPLGERRGNGDHVPAVRRQVRGLVTPGRETSRHSLAGAYRAGGDHLRTGRRQQGPVGPARRRSRSDRGQGRAGGHDLHRDRKQLLPQPGEDGQGIRHPEPQARPARLRPQPARTPVHRHQDGAAARHRARRLRADGQIVRRRQAGAGRHRALLDAVLRGRQGPHPGGGVPRSDAGAPHRKQGRSRCCLRGPREPGRQVAAEGGRDRLPARLPRRDQPHRV